MGKPDTAVSEVGRTVQAQCTAGERVFFSAHEHLACVLVIGLISTSSVSCISLLLATQWSLWQDCGSWPNTLGLFKSSL